MRDIIAIAVSMILSLAFILGMFYFFYKGKSIENADSLVKSDSVLVEQQSVLLKNDSLLINKQKELSIMLYKTNQRVSSLETFFDTTPVVKDTVFVLIR